MKILGFFAALMLAVAAHGQGTANPGGGGGMNFIAPSPTLSPSSISNSFVLINNGAATNLNVNVLTNQGGFFMGGNGTFGTNNSGSTLTVNMGTTLNGTIVAPNASSVSPSAVANVGTLDSRYMMWVRSDANYTGAAAINGLQTNTTAYTVSSGSSAVPGDYNTVATVEISANQRPSVPLDFAIVRRTVPGGSVVGGVGIGWIQAGTGAPNSDFSYFTVSTNQWIQMSGQVFYSTNYSRTLTTNGVWGFDCLVHNNSLTTAETLTNKFHLIFGIKK